MGIKNGGKMNLFDCKNFAEIVKELNERRVILNV